MSASPILQVRGLRLVVGGPGGNRPVDGVDLDVAEHEIFGIVGESGSGKTLTTRAVLGLLPPGIRHDAGTIEFRGGGPDPSVGIRGRRHGVSLIPQHASAALNPLVRAGRQVQAALRAQGIPKRERRVRALELLADLGLADPEGIAQRFPHQLSGGQQQRVVVAAALAASPTLLIADEPTSALDPLVRLQFLDLLKKVQADRQMAVILVSHDLGVVARVCDRVAVMYGGRIMESGPVDEILERPRHPYTEGLLRATPNLESRVPAIPIPGRPLSATIVGDACPFAARCPHVHDRCAAARPPLFTVDAGHESACWLAATDLRRSAAGEVTAP